MVDSVSDKSTEPTIWRRVPWTCFWGCFDGQALTLGVSGERCFWYCHREVDTPRPVLKGECEKCAYWQSRPTALASDD